MKRLNYILPLFLLLTANSILAQTPAQIKDVVNKYVKVTSVVDASSVNVFSSAEFASGDTVMIAQMKGAVYSPEDPNVINFPYSMGKYELTIINNIIGNKVIFNSPLKNTYNPLESVQLIRVPSYNNVEVIQELTCLPWDGEKGGVLVMVASGTIELNADINVSGKGFRGALPVTFATGKCFATNSVPYLTYNILNIHPDSTSGKKGEGVISNSFVYTMGKGPAGNGGGAGSGAFAGGGGGGNRGIGGNGAKESCADEEDLNWGGNGGRIDGQYFDNSLIQRRIFLGGGGGSGIQKTPTSGTSGANGGGIVILLAPHLNTNGNIIKANGGDVTGLVSDGSSSGGGGGGGMVLLTLDSVKNSLKVSVKGGKGGSTSGSNCTGHGAGGGGGFVWFSGKNMNFSQLDLSAGSPGSGICDVSSTAGESGDSLNRLLLPLTGFLNNLIYAESKTCYNTKQIIKGSHPQGGNGIYTYLWQYRNYGSATWLTAPGKNDSVDYTTSFLTDTLQFRRVVTSDGMVDYSKNVTIDVFPQITNNVINPDTVLCFGSPNVTIRGSVAGGGIGNIQYEWSLRTLSGSWDLAPSDVRTGKDYTLSADISRYYRRKAISDYCSISDSVKVDILPVISDNLIAPRQTICFNAAPEPFMGSTPQGGTGSGYKYNWQKSNDSLGWTNAGITSKDVLSPSTLSQITYYRRIVSSGLSDCCRDTSKNIKIIVLPTITNNSVSAPQIICEATKPALFNGSEPAGGDIDDGYRYKWESSKNTVSWDSLEYSINIRNYQALEQDTTQYFRRVVYSGLNDCCKSISNNIKVTVQPKIKNNQITGDTVVCDNTVPALLEGLYSTFSGGDGSVYTPKWMQKTVDGTWQDATGANSQNNYQPPALNDTMLYQRLIISGTCTGYSNIVSINVLNTIQGNLITGNSAVCDGFPAEPLSSESLSGGEPGVYRINWDKSLDGESNWSNITGETDIQLQPGILSEDLFFRRNIKSGPYDCCLSTSNAFKISIDKKPEVPVAGSDRELIYQDTAYLNAMPVTIGKGIWSTFSDAVINDPESYSTKVSELQFGRYAFYWTVTNGVCPSVQDSVIVNLIDLQRFTGFSPNGDNINDFFIIDGLENAGNKELSILNRWGVEVFRSGDYQNNWDGTGKNGEPLPEDTYYYVLKVNDIFNQGKQRVYKGYVVIKR